MTILIFKGKYKKSLRCLGAMMDLRGGNIFSIDFSTQNDFLAWFDGIVEKSDFNLKLISRLPPRRLIEHLDLSKFSLIWLTERKSNNSLPPNLDKIKQQIIKSDNEESNLVVMDGFEWLLDLHGEKDIINFIYDLSDSLTTCNTKLILPINSLAFETSWFTRFRKEVLPIREGDEELSQSDSYDEVLKGSELKANERIEFEIGIDGSPRLTILSRLPEIGFTKELLVKRILQWRRMGLDVSELEPALNYESKSSYQLYRKVEEKIRRVVELENHLYHNIDEISSTEISTSLFKIKQLTSIEELEKKYYS